MIQLQQLIPQLLLYKCYSNWCNIRYISLRANQGLDEFANDGNTVENDGIADDTQGFYYELDTTAEVVVPVDVIQDTQEEIEAVVEITQQVEVEVEVPVESTVTSTAPAG